MGTKDLTLIPVAQPEDSVLVHTRDFLLADYGPAAAVESSHTTGHFDSDYRSIYRDRDKRTGDKGTAHLSSSRPDRNIAGRVTSVSVMTLVNDVTRRDGA